MEWLDYEHFVVDHHKQKHPDADVWHWHHIPEDELWKSGWIHCFNKLRMMKHRAQKEGKNVRQEYGLDGLVRYAEGSYSGMQAKHWLGRKKLTANHLGTFTHSVLNMKRGDARSHGILYHTCGLEINLKETLMNLPDVIRAVKLPFVKGAGWHESVDETAYEPYSHQLEALDVLRAGWNDVGVLSMPPGTGKTLVFSRHVLESKYKNIIILSPLQVQAEQSLHRVKRFLEGQKDALKVDCEGDGTRDVDQIREGLQKGVFVSATYESVDVLLAATEGVTDMSEDLLIIDESHNISNNGDIRTLMKRYSRCLLVSGTPPNRYSEEDEEPFTLYKLSFREAIQRGYITDYLVYMPVLMKNEEVGNACQLDCVKDRTNASQAEFLATGMLRTGARRCIAYFLTVEDCKEFLKTIKVIFERFHAETFWGECITCEVGSGKREEVLSEFRKAGDVIKVIASVRILDEGIDIPECDSVFINSIAIKTGDRGHMRAVQRLCRAVRKDRFNPSKVAKAFVYAEEDESLANLFALLKDNDPKFHLRVRGLSSQYDNAMTTDVVAEEAKRKEELMGHIIGIETLEERAMRKAKACVAWIKEHNKNPLAKDAKNDIEKKHGIWLGGVRAPRRLLHYTELYPTVITYLDENIPGWSDTRETLSMKCAHQCVEWIQKHQKNPSPVAIDATEKRQAQWLNSMRQATKNHGSTKIYPSVKVFLDEHIPGWSDDLETICLNHAKACFLWVEQHHRIPIIKSECASSDDVVETSHGTWLSRMRSAFHANVKKRGISNLYPSVKTYLDANIPGWSDDREAKSLKSAKACVAWVQANNGVYPRCNAAIGSIEKFHSNWLNNVLSVYKNTGTVKIFPSVIDYLKMHIPGKFDIIDKESKSLSKAKEYVTWIQANNGVYPFHKAMKGSIEKKAYDWLSLLRSASRGKGNANLYPSVRIYLENNIPGFFD